MNKNEPLLLTQYRENTKYRNFLGYLYHFPKSYNKNFDNLPIEFVFYEPIKNGKGEFYGSGLIYEIIPDNENEDFHFGIIKDFQFFKKPVSYRNNEGVLIESKSPYYNPENSVRKIPSEIFNEICLQGGIDLKFTSDAHLIKVLGEQLIGSERVGVLELIKNAIDAQASYCRVRLEKIKALDHYDETEYEFSKFDGPIIVIEDDGVGMSLDVVKNGWLRPASIIKTNIKEKIKIERDKAKETGNLGTFDALINQIKKEHGNKIPLGEKGVGRFATHRLGKQLVLKTKTKDSPYEIEVKINWDDFDIISDDFVDLDTVGVSVLKQSPTRSYGKTGSGTQLIIYGGRDGFSWNKSNIMDLNRAILSLNSPESKNKKKSKENFRQFNAYLECPQIEDLPKNLIFERSTPNFSLYVSINEEGIADYQMKFKHPTDKLLPESWQEEGVDLRLLNKDDSDYWIFMGEKRSPQCGAFEIHMDIWYRTREWIDVEPFTDLTDYLAEFGGMSIYRDNILVFDSKLGAELDWLGLTEGRIRKASKLSYRDFIGNININQETNIHLQDKTNREGLVKNQAFLDLAKITTNAIDHLLLNRYIGKRLELSKLTKGIISNPKELSKATKQGSSLISNIAKSEYQFEIDPFNFFEGVWERGEDRKEGLVNLEGSIKELRKSISMLEEVQEQFIEQAGFGIAVAISLHEINKIATNFYQGVLHLSKRDDFDKIKIEEIRDTAKSLKTELSRLGPLRTIRNERSIEFDVKRSIKFANEIYKRKLNKNNISFKILNPDDSFNIYGRYGAMNQVFANLFDNSIYWIENANQKNGQISVNFDKKNRSIVFADSGTDISDIIRPYLFQPGYSLKVPQSGLGLYICKSYLDSMKARIYETPIKDRLKDLSGAHFTIDFGKTPAKREDK